MRDLVSRFWAPADLAELRVAVVEAAGADGPDASEAYGWGGDPGAVAFARLPVPRLHPAVLPAWARSRGWSVTAAAAVAAEAAWVDEAGRPVRWPWYREEDAEERPRAERADDGLALPPRLLDEPFDPSWYFARSGPAALDGLDAFVVSVVPLPPAGRWRPARHEGGWTGPSALEQHVRRLIHGVVEDEEALDALLRRVCAGFGGEVAPAPAVEPESGVPGEGDPVDDGAPARLDGLRGVAGGVEVTAGARVRRVSPDGPGVRFARASDALPGWGDGVASTCGRYLLATREEPTIVRVSDGVVVAELPTPRAPRRTLLPPRAGATTTLGGVRFTVSRAGTAVAPGTPEALAVGPGGQWRWVVDGVLGVGRKAVASLGDAARHAAFAPDGRAVWVLTDDALHHLVEEGGDWRLAASWPAAEVTP